MSSPDTAIKVENLSKSFKLPHEKQSSVKGKAINMFRPQTFEKQRVLRNVSFEIKKGDFFGIVGRNGSGKSTLLKLLAGIYTSDEGNVSVNGSLTPFIELGVGFNPELSGRENVFLNGALLGFSRKQVEGMYQEIVDFAELERFMDQKLKNYSSGMQVRLAFSIAIKAESDILLFDEVLAVGDANFQRKCYDVFKNIKSKKTVILVTHDMSAVEQYCNKAALIEDGKIVLNGAPEQVTKLYNKLNLEVIDQSAKDSHQTALERNSTGPVRIESVWLEKGGHKTQALTPDNHIEFFMKCKVLEKVEDPVVGITLKDQAGKPIFATNTKAKKVSTGSFNAGQSFTAHFSISNMYSDGNYYLVPAVTNKDTSVVFDSIEEGYRFAVSGWDYPAFVTQPTHSIKIVNKGNR